VLADHGLVGEHTRFAYLGLEEPPKQEVLAFTAGDPVDRRVRAILLDTRTGAAADVVASLTRGAIDSSVELDTAREGQPPIMLEDLIAVDEIVKADSGWRAAVARRGITELDLVRPCPLSAGRAGACCGCCRSCSTTPRTTRGPTRSTAWSPTSTSSSAACCT
jgi:primary-amine oxidase